MKVLYHSLTKYPLSWLVILIIWIICIIPIPETPLGEVAFIDKWTHVVMYLGLCATIWFEYLRKHQTTDYWKTFWMAFLVPFLMGGLIEIVQANCTGGRRSGDWLDFIADGVGVTIAYLIGILLARFLANRRKDQ